MRSAHVPRLALAIRRQDECALSRSYQHAYSTHRSNLSQAASKWTRPARGSIDEWSTRAGRNAKGRIRPDGGWQARVVGRERTAFRRLGDLPRQGIAG